MGQGGGPKDGSQKDPTGNSRRVSTKDFCLAVGKKTLPRAGGKKEVEYGGRQGA